MFLIRARNTRKFISIRFAPVKMLFNTLALLCEALLMILEVPLWPLWCGLLLAALVWGIGSSLWRGVRGFLARRGGPATRPELPGQNQQ